MMFKAVLFCAAFLLVQSISAQKKSSLVQYTCAKKNSYSSSGSCCGISVPSCGGDFPVTSVGPISPSGISVSSNLDLNGDLDISGEMPWLSAVQFQTNLDTTGSGCVDYSCGDCGSVGIISVSGGSGCCSCK